MAPVEGPRTRHCSRSIASSMVNSCTLRSLLLGNNRGGMVDVTSELFEQVSAFDTCAGALPALPVDIMSIALFVGVYCVLHGWMYFKTFCHYLMSCYMLDTGSST